MTTHTSSAWRITVGQDVFIEGSNAGLRHPLDRCRGPGPREAAGCGSECPIASPALVGGAGRCGERPRSMPALAAGNQPRTARSVARPPSLRLERAGSLTVAVALPPTHCCGAWRPAGGQAGAMHQRGSVQCVVRVSPPLAAANSPPPRWLSRPRSRGPFTATAKCSRTRALKPLPFGRTETSSISMAGFGRRRRWHSARRSPLRAATASLRRPAWRVAR
jgi:hypothetical protein